MTPFDAFGGCCILVLLAGWFLTAGETKNAPNVQSPIAREDLEKNAAIAKRRLGL